MTNLEVLNTTLDNLKLVKPATNFLDFRGRYLEIYNTNLYKRAKISIDFIQDDVSISSKGVLRGLHGDRKTWKLISCLTGTLYVIVVNNDENSRQYRKWENFTLSGENYFQLLIPPNFGVGHLVMSNSAIFHYKQSTEYDREAQFTIKWNDPNFNFWWPINNPITSVRDFA
jgi:dTDP-4-dehydrorhamnose 3,5-epimerase